MNLLPIYETRIVPALRRIQERHGYLKREAVEQFAKEAGLPVHRVQAVASFFPHFRMEPPPPVTLRVCRDMACHMAGGGKMIADLAQACGDKVKVEGASCLGRCDRAPAACAAIHRAGPDGAGHEEEHLYLGRTTAQLKAIAERCVAAAAAAGPVPKPDHDADLPYDANDWEINPYRAASDAAEPPPDPYAAAKRVAAARQRAIATAAAALREKRGWTRDRADLFTLAATRRLIVDTPLDDELKDAVRDWQTDSGWARGPEMGGWSEPFLQELDDAHADLRGMGGAGIPATTKWRDVRDAVRTARRRRQDDRGFIVVNGDESEPGTFKDRELLLRSPHLIVEAVIVAGLLTEATEAFVYIRHEYHEQIEACEREIRRAEDLGVCGAVSAAELGRPLRVSVFVSPGGYICGEQSALIEAMSDRRGEPRNMPPKLETNGLKDRPTLVSNVETYAWVPYILLNGGEQYAALGQNGWRGRRFFSVSGDVNRPGVYEVPMGLTLRELVTGDDYCRGMKGNRPLKAIAPSGPSGGFLPARLTAKAGLPRDHTKNKSFTALADRRGLDPMSQTLDVLDLELELNLFRAISPTQALGAGIVIYADTRDMAEQAVNSIEFYRNESCGKCVPCRIGSQKMAALGSNLLAGRIGEARWADELAPAVKELGKVMELSSICGLGRSVPVPLRTVTEFFKADLEKHLAGGGGAAAGDGNGSEIGGRQAAVAAMAAVGVPASAGPMTLVGTTREAGR